MRYPISPRAQKFVRDRATAMMRYTCRIERVTPPSYDESTLIATAGGRTTIYEGVCRVWGVTSGASAINLGETEIPMQSTRLSIPWTVTEVPQRNDEVVIVSAVNEDPAVLGKRFRIESSSKAGELRATREFEVSLMDRTYGQ